ncbi:Uncharacterised protein [Serratia rubidaea]|uniref:Uncharacterized protein n=1 Tax=Serratia rubidaea TaxID=61652 RepID=A0A3S4H3H4_SERRU|nr:Uncharacterised protein [Serratia rubidaea]
MLAYQTGNPQRPMNAIPASATAVCQLRFVVGTDWQRLVEHLQAHLQAHGFDHVEVEWLHGTPRPASILRIRWCTGRSVLCSAPAVKTGAAA